MEKRQNERVENDLRHTGLGIYYRSDSLAEKMNGSKLYDWSLRDTPVANVIKKIKKLPQPLQPWVGRMIWWDRYADKNVETPGFAEWLFSRNDPDPAPVDLAKALVELGYTHDYAGMRAGAQQWASVGMRRGRQVETGAKKAPTGTTFPIRLGARVSVHMTQNAEGWQGYRTELKQRKGKAIRRSFADFYSAMEYAESWKSKMDGGIEP